MYNRIDGTPINERAPSENENSTLVYDKCIGCPDVGIICNGPNMLTLPIDGVREMVKRRKNTLKLTNEKLSEKSGIPITTINRFLSPSVTTDFKYTTVSDIVKAVIGYGQEGYNFNENPCPATTAEIRQRNEETSAQLEASQEECAQLRAALEESNQKRRDQRTEIKQEDQRKIDHLKEQVGYLEERCEYLKETAEKRYGLIVDRDKQIASLQKTASIWRTAFIMMLLIGAVLAVLLSIYLVWDYLHVGSGIIW